MHYSCRPFCKSDCAVLSSPRNSLEGCVKKSRSPGKIPVKAAKSDGDTIFSIVHYLRVSRRNRPYAISKVIRDLIFDRSGIGTIRIVDQSAILQSALNEENNGIKIGNVWNVLRERIRPRNGNYCRNPRNLLRKSIPLHATVRCEGVVFPMRFPVRVIERGET